MGSLREYLVILSGSVLTKPLNVSHTGLGLFLQGTFSRLCATHSLTLSKSFCSLRDFSSRSLSRSCWAFSCFSSCFFLDSAMVLSKKKQKNRRIIDLFLLHIQSVTPAKQGPAAARSLAEIVNGLAWGIHLIILVHE